MCMLEVKFYTVLDTSPCNLIGECVRQIEITKTNIQLYLQPPKNVCNTRQLQYKNTGIYT
jgi:hypothetical protein